jgi:hypothetical protein
MSNNGPISGVSYDSYYNWFQETIQNMFENMPSNLVDMGDPPDESAFYEAMAAAEHPEDFYRMSKRRRQITAARAYREARRRGQQP